MEDKKKILDLLLPALQETQDLQYLMSLVYVNDDRGNERVIAIFPEGDKIVDVTGDNGREIVLDVTTVIF